MTDIFALLISGITFGWQICNSFVYRSRLYVSIDFVPVISASFVTWSIVLNLTNLGQETIFIKNIFAIKQENGKNSKENMEVLLGNRFPTRAILANQMVRIDFPLSSWKFGPYTMIEIETTRGKIYKIKKKDLDRIEENILDTDPDWSKKHR